MNLARSSGSAAPSWSRWPPNSSRAACTVSTRLPVMLPIDPSSLARAADSGRCLMTSQKNPRSCLCSARWNACWRSSSVDRASSSANRSGEIVMTPTLPRRGAVQSAQARGGRPPPPCRSRSGSHSCGGWLSSPGGTSGWRQARSSSSAANDQQHGRPEAEAAGHRVVRGDPLVEVLQRVAEHAEVAAADQRTAERTRLGQRGKPGDRRAARSGGCRGGRPAGPGSTPRMTPSATARNTRLTGA